MKEHGKVFKAAMYIILFVIYMLLLALVDDYNKTIFALMFISAVCNLALSIWNKEKSAILIILSVVMLIYSVLVFCGYNANDISKNYSDNQLLMFIVAAAHIFAQRSVVMIILWGFFAIICIYEITKRKRNTFLKKKNGPLPKLNGVSRGSEKVYLHHDHKRNVIELIYMKGRKKKVIETFHIKGFLYEHYSMEWDGKEDVVVRGYNRETHELVMDKKVKVPR